MSMPHVTADQHAQALAHTETVLTSIRDLCRKLDLPAESIAVAVELYSAKVDDLLMRDVSAAMEAREKKSDKIHELRAQREPRRNKRLGDYIPGMAVDSAGIFGAPMVAGGCDDVYDMDDAQLDAELARLESLPRSVP